MVVRVVVSPGAEAVFGDRRPLHHGGPDTAPADSSSRGDHLGDKGPMKFVKTAVLALGMLMLAQVPPPPRPPEPVQASSRSVRGSPGDRRRTRDHGCGLRDRQPDQVGRREHGPPARNGRQHPDGDDHLGRAHRRCDLLRADHHPAANVLSLTDRRNARTTNRRTGDLRIDRGRTRVIRSSPPSRSRSGADRSEPLTRSSSMLPATDCGHCLDGLGIRTARPGGRYPQNFRRPQSRGPRD